MLLIRRKIRCFNGVLEVDVVHAASLPGSDVSDEGFVLAKSLVDSVESSGVVDEVSGGSIGELSSSGDDVGSSLTSNVGALISVSLVTVVASARLATVGVVGASSVGVAWVGGVTDITPAEVGSVDVSAEVETGVARAIEVVTVVGAGSVSLAWGDVCDSANPCDANAACSNNADGSQSCACNDGYKGDGYECTNIAGERAANIIARAAEFADTAA